MDGIVGEEVNEEAVIGYEGNVPLARGDKQMAKETGEVVREVWGGARRDNAFSQA